TVQASGLLFCPVAAERSGHSQGPTSGAASQFTTRYLTQGGQSMRRRLQLTALTCVAVLLMAGATPAAARLRLNFSGPDTEWSDDLVQTSVTGSVVCGLTPGTAQGLSTLAGTFRLTDIVIANPSLVAERVTIADVTGPRLTVVVPASSTFT